MSQTTPRPVWGSLFAFLTSTVGFLIAIQVNGFMGSVLLHSLPTFLSFMWPLGAELCLWTLGAIAGYWSHYRASRCRLMTAAISIAAMALGYAYEVTVIAPAMLDWLIESAGQDYAMAREFADAAAAAPLYSAAITPLPPLIAGAVTSIVLSWTHGSRMKGGRALQRTALALTSILMRLTGVAMFLYASFGFLATFLPNFIGFVFHLADNGTPGAMVSRAPFPWLLLYIVILLFYLFLKLCIAMVYAVIGYMIQDWGRRCGIAARSIPDTPPSTLILRSFEDDGATVQVREETEAAQAMGVPEKSWIRGLPFIDVLFLFAELLKWFLWPSHEQLLGEVSRYLPNAGVVGDPRESLPPWSSKWYYLDEDNWQDDVARMIEAAEMIILCVGTSPSVKWEMEQVMKMNALPKTLFLVPEGKGRDERLKAFRSAADSTKMTLKGIEALNSDTAYFAVNCDGELHSVSSELPTENIWNDIRQKLVT